VRNRDCRANAYGKNFRAVLIFCQKKIREKILAEKFMEFSDFNPRNFGLANFQPKFFFIFQLSNRKKIPKIQITGDQIVTGLRRECELVT